MKSDEFGRNSKIDLDDPKLTAFALGELEGEEEVAMKQMIEKDPEAQEQVKQIRSTAIELGDQLRAEEVPRLSVEEREHLLSQTVEPSRAGISWWKSWKLMVPMTGAVAAGLIAILLSNGPLHIRSDVLPRVVRPTVVAKNPMAEAPTAEAPTELEVKSEPVVVAANEAPSTEAPSTSSPRVEDPNSSLTADFSMSTQESRPSGSGAVMDEDEGSAKARSSIAAKDSLARPDLSQVQYGKSAKRYLPSESSKGFGSSVQSRVRRSLEPQNTESYSYLAENEFKSVGDQPLSTFSIDVDTASYANVRRFLVGSQLPPTDAIRIEEMINYFKYDYPTPKDGKAFSVTTEISMAPWNANHQLFRVGLKGRESAAENRPASNLVFLVDVSGSMDQPNKLPLLIKSFKLLVEQLRSKDRVALVVYAGSSGVVLPSTAGTEKAKILEALERLHAGGSTNGASGIELAYDVAQKSFIKGGLNRVILATDGDFNVGVSSEGQLTRLIEEKAKSGVFLTVLGFGMGNYKDSIMQKLADKGNGNHAYIDSIREARKVLVEQVGGTLNTIAKDVKIQIEFNPKLVGSYRLIGYEKRLLNNEDFNDDTKDAGEIGEGHTVTALYELTPPGEIGGPAPKVDALKYQKTSEAGSQASSQSAPAAATDELLTVKLRFKKSDGDVSEKIEVPVKNEKREFLKASGDMKFASSVAGFGMLLRKSPNSGDFSLDQIEQLASQNLKVRGQDDEYRKEFVELVKKAKSLQNRK